MECTSDFEGYCRRCQMPQAISDVLNPHARTSDMHLPNSAVGQPPPLPSADCPVYDPSMSHASRSLGTDWNIHAQPPASAVGQRPVHCAGGSGCAPSMSRASGSLDSNFNMHTTIGLPTADNLYQNSIQSSSIVQYRATGVGTEDHLSPGRTLGRTWSSAPSHFAQEISPPNKNSMQYIAPGFGLEDCLSPGQATNCAWPSAPSPITPGASPPNGNNNEVDDVEATSARNDPQNQE
ncbi:hypothetical protein LT330_009501 [Penicillium expansum]|nr:hypothetical protein LT330_009501 [Penicillium expansum]